MSWLFSIYSLLPIYDTLRILHLAVCSREKQKYSLFSSPVSSRPYHLVYILSKRVLFQTNIHHLCAFPNTWSESKPNRLTKSGEIFPKQNRRKDQLWTKTIDFSMVWGKESSLAGIHGKAKFIWLSANIEYLYWIQCKEFPCVLLGATNFWMIYFLSSRIILEQNKRWSTTVHCDKCNGWKALVIKIQNGTINSKTQPL